MQHLHQHDAAHLVYDIAKPRPDGPSALVLTPLELIDKVAALLIDAIKESAVLRVRPKAMTVAVILAGLVPIFVGSGTGSEVMQRIAAPMMGGMITAPLLSMLIVPAAYLLLLSRVLQ